MRRFVIGTAGHVDHGKTTLVQALTGVDTDRLPEEKRRGITIELGFAPWNIDEDLHVSIIDVPGHRRLVHTMIAGAAGIELVLLVVAADEGVMPQTREHVAACELLGIPRAIVAVTKLDRAGRELAEMAGEEARELLGDRFRSDVVLCSARTGEGLAELREAVKKALLSLPARHLSPRARLSVDRVFTVRGAGTVVTGTLVEGSLELGTPLRVVSSSQGLSTSVRGLHIHDLPAQKAEAPTRLAINLAGLPLESVHRGDVVTTDPLLGASRILDVSLRAFSPVRYGMTAQVYAGTSRSVARIDPIGDTQSAQDVVRLRLHSPLIVAGGDRFVLRGSDIEGPSGAVIGGGVVMDARPPRKRPRALRRAVMEALLAGDAVQTVRALSAEVTPKPLSREGFGARFPIAAEALLKAAEGLVSRGELVRLRTAGYSRRDQLMILAAKARRLVEEHHQKAPLDRGLGLETLRRKMAAVAGDEAAQEIIRMAAGKNNEIAGESIVIEGDIVKLPHFTAGAAGLPLTGALGALGKAIVEAGLKGVSEFGAREVTQVSPREVKAMLAKLVRDGLAICVGELWFPKAKVDELRERVIAHLNDAERLSIADFKNLSGLGRKQAIPLLELFDRENVTRREGDDRVRPPSLQPLQRPASKPS